MSDWRSKPRTGKSQFMPHLDEIKRLVEVGHTARQIYDALAEQEQVTISYEQFSRYVRTYIKLPAAGQVKPNVGGSTPPTARATTNPVQTTTRTSTGDRRREDFIHNPVPDKSRIYGE